MAIDIRDGNSFINPEAPISWRQDVSISGVSIPIIHLYSLNLPSKNNIMTLGIWYEALMRWIGTAKSVLAKGKIFTKQRKNDKGELVDIGVPEHVDVIAGK